MGDFPSQRKVDSRCRSQSNKMRRNASNIRNSHPDQSDHDTESRYGFPNIAGSVRRNPKISRPRPKSIKLSPRRDRRDKSQSAVRQRRRSNGFMTNTCDARKLFSFDGNRAKPTSGKLRLRDSVVVCVEMDSSGCGDSQAWRFHCLYRQLVSHPSHALDVCRISTEALVLELLWRSCVP